MDKALVKNAADKKQVKSAKQKERSIRDKEINDLAWVLNSPEGRRFIWKMLEHCSVFASVCSPSGSMTYYHSGKQDVGHWLMAQINEVDPEIYVKLMLENKKGKD